MPASTSGSVRVGGARSGLSTAADGSSRIGKSPSPPSERLVCFVHQCRAKQQSRFRSLCFPIGFPVLALEDRHLRVAGGRRKSSSPFAWIPAVPNSGALILPVLPISCAARDRFSACRRPEQRRWHLLFLKQIKPERCRMPTRLGTRFPGQPRAWLSRGRSRDSAAHSFIPAAAALMPDRTTQTDQTRHTSAFDQDCRVLLPGLSDTPGAQKRWCWSARQA